MLNGLARCLPRKRKPEKDTLTGVPLRNTKVSTGAPKFSVEVRRDGRKAETLRGLSYFAPSRSSWARPGNNRRGCGVIQMSTVLMGRNLLRTRILTFLLIILAAALVVACGGEDAPSPTPASTHTPAGTSSPAIAEVEAPIEDVTLHALEFDPVQYFLVIGSGLPNACHTFDRTDVERTGMEITVSVINRIRAGDVACAEIYRSESHTVALGTDFEPGTTYTVRVNDWETSFTTAAVPVEVDAEAPIEDVTVHVLESDPVQYFLEIRAGVPNTCHTFDRIDVERSGKEMTVAVINRVVTGDIACEEIQRVAPHSVALGSDFEPGATYTVRVNDWETSFTTAAVPVEVDVEAPIEDVTVHVLESDPVRYFLEIKAGVPNTCHTFDRTDVERSGREITVSVINRVATGEAVCAEVYRSAPHVVALGSAFEPGVTYTARVNGETLTFTAE